MKGSTALKTLYTRTNKYDMATLRALYDNREKPLLDVIKDLPFPLSEENIRLRYFRCTKDKAFAAKTIGPNFKFFLVLGGAIKVNPEKADELRWILGV